MMSVSWPGRIMSFSHTTQQMYDKQKSVTRRVGWEYLRPGDPLVAVVQSQGLRAGEKVVRIAPLTVTSVSREPLQAILDYPHVEVINEGFPNLTNQEFFELLLEITQLKPTDKITRIIFKFAPVNMRLF